MRLRLTYLALILTLLLLTASCGRAEGNPPPSADATATLTDVTTTATEASPRPWTVAGTPLSDYCIIHDDTDYAESCAKRVRLAIYEATGHSLTILPDTVRQSPHEILIGKTDRAESVAVRAEFDRPNLCYRVQTLGERPVIMGEGYTTLELAVDRFVEALSATGHQNDLSHIVCSGDLRKNNSADPRVTMLDRAEDTDLRVFHWNMAAPYLDPAVTPPPVVYDSNTTRGEIMADLILQMLPDIITTNEFYESHNGNKAFFNAVMGELGEYYICLDSPYDKDQPIAGADAIKGKTINSNILYRRDAGLQVIASSWRYSTEKATITAANPGGFVYYHGSHTAVFEKDGQRFILSTAHYADGRSDNRWAVEQLAAIADADAGQQLPVILTGDLYTSYSSESQNSAYRYLVNNGYTDAQRHADFNANGNITHGTFHKIGTRQQNRISEDFIFYTAPIRVLRFKVLASKITDDTSDHYPVLADLKWQ